MSDIPPTLKKWIGRLLAPTISWGLAIWEGIQKQTTLAIILGIAGTVILLLGWFGWEVAKQLSKNLDFDLVKVTADWLAAAIQGFAPSFRKRYNQQIWFSHRRFNTEGLQTIGNKSILLDEVFVDLRVATNSPQQVSRDLLARRQLEGRCSVWEILKPPHLTSREKKRIIAQGGGIIFEPLVILGPPGCGKTTLLQHLALNLAANHQNRYKLPAYVPILLFVRDHLEEILVDKTLTEIVQVYFNDSKRYKNLGRVPPGWFETKLRKGCLVMLDGLDEIADLTQRKKVSKWIEQQAANNIHSRFIITARPLGYRTAPLKYAQVYEVENFDDEQVRNFIARWYKATKVNSYNGRLDKGVFEEAEKAADDLLKRLASQPNLQDLTANPLLLTMIALVHNYSGKQLPANRVRLYAEICMILLGPRRGMAENNFGLASIDLNANNENSKVKQNFTSILADLGVERKLAIMRPLAYYMLSNNKRDISTKEAIDIIKKPLGRVTQSSSIELADAFLHNIQEGGLFLEREQDKWTFAHFTFQEYLTSCYWLQPSNSKGNYTIPTTFEEWRKFVIDSWFHETLRLYVAQTNATEVIKACLETNEVTALKLASECLQEALEMDNEVRQALETRLLTAIDSNDKELAKIAAEFKLNLRLKNAFLFQDKKQKSEIDSSPITCAEFQLFIDEMKIMQKSYQPDHWLTSHFTIGEGNLSVKGIRNSVAMEFCDWVNDRQSGISIYRYRLPTVAEIQNLNQLASLNELRDESYIWCTSEVTSFSIFGLPINLKQTMVTSLKHLDTATNSNFSPIDPYTTKITKQSLSSRFKQKGDQIYKLNQNILYTRQNILDVVYSITRVCDISSAFLRDIARDLDRNFPPFPLNSTTFRPIDLPFTSSKELALYLDTAFNYTSEIDFNLDMARVVEFRFFGNLALHLNRDIALHLDRIYELDVLPLSSNNPHFDLDLDVDLHLLLNNFEDQRSILISLIKTMLSLENSRHKQISDIKNSSNFMLVKLIIDNTEGINNFKRELFEFITKNTQEEFIKFFQVLPNLDSQHQRKIMALRRFLVPLVTQNTVEKHLADLDYFLCLNRILMEHIENYPKILLLNSRSFIREIKLNPIREKNKNSEVAIEKLKKEIETEYWWLQLAKLRTKGLVPPWEGILLVREQTAN